MKTSGTLLVILALFVILGISCGPEPTPTAAPTQAPTEIPAHTPTAAPSQEPTPQRPLLGDIRVRTADDMVTVFVPAGEFLMGSPDEELAYALELCQGYTLDCGQVPFEREQPQRLVALDAFWIDKTEVTNAQYQRCMDTGACTAPACWEENTLYEAELWSETKFGAPEQPVVCVNWFQAEAYCAWVGGRLPSEAEWEYAARGPEALDYPWGESFDSSRLNYCDASCELPRSDGAGDDGVAYTAAVGSFPGGASWCGALDLAGNVWEWVIDWYANYLPGREVNPPGAPSGTNRVARGGAWHSTSYASRGAYRGWGSPDLGSTVAGFRCVVPEAP